MLLSVTDMFLSVKSDEPEDIELKAFHYPGVYMEFSERLAHIRKQRDLTQKTLAEIVGVHVVQLRRYEGGKSQPTLDVIRKLATALHITANELIFDEYERGPDADLRLQFEAISKFNMEEKQIIKALLEGMILKHEAKRWSSPSF